MDNNQARWTRKDGTTQIGDGPTLMKAWWDSGKDGTLEPLTPTPNGEWPTLHFRPMEVDPSKAAEIAKRTAALAKLGFALPNTWFAPGTRMLQMGVNKYQQLHSEWADRPIFADSLREVRDHIRAEKRTDFVVPLSSLRMEKNGFIRRPGSKSAIAVEPLAFDKLVDYAAPVLPRAKAVMATLDPDQRADVWNRQIAKLGNIPIKVGVRKNATTGWSLFRAVSVTYPTDGQGDVMLDLVIQGLGKNGKNMRGSVSYNPTNTVITFDGCLMADPIALDPAVGDVFRMGLRGITADGAAYGAFEIDPFAGRIICVNCTIANGYAPGYRRVHRGSMTPARAGTRDVLGRVEQGLKLFAEDWKLLRNVSVADAPWTAVGVGAKENRKIKTAEDAIGALLSAGAVTGVSQDATLKALTKEPGESVVDVLNAITRAAHEDLFDSLNRWKAEREAGLLMPVLARTVRDTNTKAMPLQ